MPFYGGWSLLNEVLLVLFNFDLSTKLWWIFRSGLLIFFPTIYVSKYLKLHLFSEFASNAFCPVKTKIFNC